MRAANIPKTTIITPLGLFEFIYFPFGLRNTAQTFQRMMVKIFGDLLFFFIYLNDILVYPTPWTLPGDSWALSLQLWL